MKKNLLVMVIGAIVIGGFLVWWLVGNNRETGSVATINKAMALGQTMRCTHTAGDDVKGMVPVVYVDGEKYRSEKEINDFVKIHTVYDGKTRYMWDAVTKQGSKINTACLEKLKEATANRPSFVLPDTNEGIKRVANLEEMQCVAVDSVDLSVPKDINFVDECEIYEAMAK